MNFCSHSHKKTRIAALLLLASAFFCAPSAFAADSDDNEALAKKLANPIAAIINVPLQFSYDRRIGPGEDGEKTTLKLQPVIPFSLGGDWTMISRTILPFDWQDKTVPGQNTDFGIGDITQSFFFVPKIPGLIFGFGPALLLPTATSRLMGGEKWGAGPTAIIAKESGPWTTGFLTNHIWSVAGNHDRSDVSQTLLQPFVSYTTPQAWTFNLQSEATYDWKANEASIPANFTVSKVIRIGKIPFSLSGGVGYWVDSPKDSGPEGWRFKTGITFMIPK